MVRGILSAMFRGALAEPDRSADLLEIGVCFLMESHFTAELPEPGIYRHYKGKFYEVLGTAVHSESGEQLVVYRACYGKRGLWVRPLSMFLGSVEVDGRSQPRFVPEEKPE